MKLIKPSIFLLITFFLKASISAQEIEISEKTKVFGFGKNISNTTMFIDEQSNVYFGARESVGIPEKNMLYRFSEGEIDEVGVFDEVTGVKEVGELSLLDFVTTADRTLLIASRLNSSKTLVEVLAYELDKESGTIDLESETNLMSVKSKTQLSYMRNQYISKVSEDGRIINFTLFNDNGKEEQMYTSSFLLKDISKIYRSSFSVDGLGKTSRWWLLFQGFNVALENSGAAYILRRDDAKKKKGISYLRYFYVNTNGEVSGENEISLGQHSVTEMDMETNASGTYVNVFRNDKKYNATSGFALLKLNGTEAQSIVDHDFNERDRFDLLNDYKGGNGKGTSKDKIKRLRTVGINSIGGKIYLIAEAIRYSGENIFENTATGDMDVTGNITLFEIEDGALSKIITYVRRDLMYPGPRLASFAFEREEKLRIIVTGKKIPLVILTYDPSTSRLAKKTFINASNGGRIAGNINFHVSAYRNGIFAGAMFLPRTGARMIKITFR